MESDNIRPWNRREFLAGVATAAAVATLPLEAAAAPPRWDDIVKAAEGEGTLNVIVPPIQPYRDSIARFQDAYPSIKLQASALTSNELEPRIRSEQQAGRFLWDVLVEGASGVVYTEQIPAGWFDPVRPYIVRPDVLDNSKWLGGFDGGFLDEQKRYTYAFQAGLERNTYVDRSQVPESEFNSLADLFNPKWKGKIAMIDPRLRGGGHLVTLLLAVFGEEKTKAFLTGQNIVLTDTPRQIDEWAVRGTYPITSGMSPSEWAYWQSQGVGQNVKPLLTPPHQTAWTPGWGIIFVPHNPPHKNAATVFINWLLSRDAQFDWAKRGFVNSRRTDVPPGLPASALDAQTFHDGLTFNTGKNARLAIRAFALAREALN